MAPKLKYQILLDLTRSNSRHTFRTYATFARPHYSSKSFVAICTVVSYRAHANSLVNDKKKNKKKKHVKGELCHG